MELPAPLVEPCVDLRDFAFMPLDIIRLFGSRFHAIASDSEWRAGLTLWAKSFHQVPAASLPDDDVELCRLAELGRDMKAWKRLRTVAMHGWVLCADGRWYHPVVAEKACEAWERKQIQRRRSLKGNAARWGARSRDEHESGGGEESPKERPDRSGHVPSTSHEESPKESLRDSQRESLKDPKGQGQGQGQGQGNLSEARATGGPPADRPPMPGGALTPEQITAIREAYPPGDWPAVHWLEGERCLQRRADEGYGFVELLDAARRYGEQQDAKGNLHTQFVRTPERFFASDGYWRGSFPLPRTTGQIRQDANIAAGQQWLAGAVA